jgi:hypothetical protein
MVSVFSAAIRKGAWRAAPRTRVVSVFGGAELDFRAARLEPGMNEFRFICVFGGADVVLPPELYVEVEGFGIFGGFSETGTDIHEPPEGAPWLRISGVAVFGGVSVTTRPPGPPDRTRKSLPEP